MPCAIEKRWSHGPLVSLIDVDVTLIRVFVMMEIIFSGITIMQMKIMDVPADHSCALHAFLVVVVVVTVRDDLFSPLRDGASDATNLFLAIEHQLQYSGDAACWKSDALCIYDHIFGKNKNSPGLSKRFVYDRWEYQRAFFAFIGAYTSNTKRMFFETLYSGPECFDEDRPWFARHATALMEKETMGCVGEDLWLSAVDVGVFSQVMESYLKMSLHDIGLCVVPSSVRMNHFVVEVRLELLNTLREKGGLWCFACPDQAKEELVQEQEVCAMVHGPRSSAVVARSNMTTMLEEDKVFNTMYPLRKYAINRGRNSGKNRVDASRPMHAACKLNTMWKGQYGAVRITMHGYQGGYPMHNLGYQNASKQTTTDQAASLCSEYGACKQHSMFDKYQGVLKDVHMKLQGHSAR